MKDVYSYLPLEKAVAVDMILQRGCCHPLEDGGKNGGQEEEENKEVLGLPLNLRPPISCRPLECRDPRRASSSASCASFYGFETMFSPVQGNYN